MQSIFSIARLAQSAERKALNLVVVGSSPTVGVLCGSPKLCVLSVASNWNSFPSACSTIQMKRIASATQPIRILSVVACQLRCVGEPTTKDPFQSDRMDPTSAWPQVRTTIAN